MSTTTTIRCRITGSARSSVIEIEAEPDEDSAAKWLRTVRRIERVELELWPDDWICTLVGVGHRLPVRRLVSLECALGLAGFGVPMVLV